MDHLRERLQRLGDRLDWLFPPERDDELAEILTPLFGEGVRAKDQAVVERHADQNDEASGRTR